MKILIVEDEPELTNSIVEYLSDKDFDCDTSSDYWDALDKVYADNYSCIILDVSLPSGNGLDILNELRRMGKDDGVLIVSARGTVQDKVKGLQKGADDYLVKPFHLAELAARVLAIIRRKSQGSGDTVNLGEVTLNMNNKMLQNDTESLALTRKEFELLVYFISNKNKVVTKEAIAEHLWGSEFEQAEQFDFIYSHIKNLRKKLQKAGASDLIKAVYGMGYKLSLA